MQNVVQTYRRVFVYFAYRIVCAIVIYYNNKGGDLMPERKAKYDDKAKARTMRYIKEKRDNLNLNLPKGDKDRYKLHAIRRGYKSLTALIVDLLENDIVSHPQDSNTDQ